MFVDLDPFQVTGFFQYPLTTKEARNINGLRSSCIHAQEKHIPLFLIIFNYQINSKSNFFLIDGKNALYQRAHEFPWLKFE